jgi:diaminopimelate epimerase
MQQTALHKIAFRKMHGLGNDFIVLDRRHEDIAVTPAGARLLAHRQLGIGCDQLILIEPPTDRRAAAFMRILNPDGSEAEACGNATRCVARVIAEERGEGANRRHIPLETLAGLIETEILPGGRVTADMGLARTGWRDIPLAREADTDDIDLTVGPLSHPVCTNLGNPHATFFVGDADALGGIAAIGRQLEHDPLFPQRANIGIASVQTRERIRLRMWERGAGETLACGSGACAAVVAAARRGLTGRHATVVLDGGELDIAWREDGHVLMTGPTTLAFEGSFDAALLAG